MNVYYAEHEMYLSAMQTVQIHEKTDINKDIYMLSRRMSFEPTTIGVNVSLYENAIISSAGSTIVSSVNMDRMSADTASFTIYTNSPSPVKNGVVLSTIRLFNGLDNPAYAPDLNNVERKMRKNEDYMLQVENSSTANTTMTINWLWREE